MSKWNKFSNIVCLVMECGNSGMDLLTARENDENAKKLSMLLKHKVAIFFKFLKIDVVVVDKCPVLFS